MTKAVYSFEEGDGGDKKLLGGKGAGLCEMTRLGLPVPPGFVVTTEICKLYYKNNGRLPGGVMEQIRQGLAGIEQKTGKRFGSRRNPLLISVRSGAAISMPGMMDTILNLGLNDDTVAGLAESGDDRFAWDSYRRFVQLFGKVVFGVDDAKFDRILDGAKRARSVQSDSALDGKSLRSVVSRCKKVCEAHAKRPFPSDPYEQLELAVRAVFDSWMGERAVVYRKEYSITNDVADGTAVNVVAMAFGNMGNDSATGVVFTRNPGTGERQIFGDYLVNAQGEDVVAGTRTPKPVSAMKLELPTQYALLIAVCKNLEKHYREPQDIEFTIERGKFYLLQTRKAKTNAAAMVKISADMVKERLIDKTQALLRLDPEKLEQLLHDTVDESRVGEFARLANGIAASPGAASGVAVFDVRRAVSLGKGGAHVILVREETKPEDVPAFFASSGILTSRGGKTSHAAVVARGMGKPCIVGAAQIRIDYTGRRCTMGDLTVSEGDEITVDGSSGTVYLGRVPTIKPEITDDFKRVLGWAQKAKAIGVRANADDPQATALARRYGARGIGLCRTERMFNAESRISLFVDMIMAETTKERKAVLWRLGRLQKNDFVGILKAMEGYPVTIRLLDPPLHEFLPNPEKLAEELRDMQNNGVAEDIERTERKLKLARSLAEVNPMMGHRGVRLGVSYPEIYEMQIQAIFDAMAKLAKAGTDARPQIMVPQVSSVEELNYVRRIYDEILARMEKKHGMHFKISFGTMIEVVRAALTAGELASTAEFFSFGTNDLTQATFSFSREDAEEKFLAEYIGKKLLKRSPFQSIDVSGVGHLMKIGVAGGRETKPKLEIGICGEHGGDPRSISFCHKAGLSYVSASPHRIPIAVVAAAQAALSEPTARKS